MKKLFLLLIVLIIGTSSYAFEICNESYCISYDIKKIHHVEMVKRENYYCLFVATKKSKDDFDVFFESKERLLKEFNYVTNTLVLIQKGKNYSLEQAHLWYDFLN